MNRNTTDPIDRREKWDRITASTRPLNSVSVEALYEARHSVHLTGCTAAREHHHHNTTGFEATQVRQRRAAKLPTRETGSEILNLRQVEI